LLLEVALVLEVLAVVVVLGDLEHPQELLVAAVLLKPH
jgi:hypothetical protein